MKQMVSTLHELRLLVRLNKLNWSLISTLHYVRHFASVHVLCNRTAMCYSSRIIIRINESKFPQIGFGLILFTSDKWCSHNIRRSWNQSGIYQKPYTIIEKALLTIYPRIYQLVVGKDIMSSCCASPGLKLA